MSCCRNLDSKFRAFSRFSRFVTTTESHAVKTVCCTRRKPAVTMSPAFVRSSSLYRIQAAQARKTLARLTHPIFCRAPATFSRLVTSQRADARQPSKPKRHRWCRLFSPASRVLRPSCTNSLKDLRRTDHGVIEKRGCRESGGRGLTATSSAASSAASGARRGA